MLSTRQEIAQRLLQGCGIEIGPGPVPTGIAEGVEVVYADKRSAEELRQYFNCQDIPQVNNLESIEKNSKDFLIACHVLEHCSNVLEALTTWMDYLRPTARLFLCVPCRFACADAGRLVTPPTHFLLDYVSGANDDSFESREHVYSFCCGWSEISALSSMERPQAMAMINQNAHSSDNDLHWHVFSADTLRFVTEMAAALSGRTCRILHMEDGHALKTDEHILVVELEPADAVDPDAAFLQDTRRTLGSRLTEMAVRRLEGRPVFMLNAQQAGKVFVAQDGKLRWVRELEELERMGLAGREATYLECAHQPEHFGEDIISTLGLLAMDRRKAVLSRLRRPQGRGLEVSPGAHGVVPREEYNLVTCDKVAEEKYKKNYREETCPAIDVVLGDAALDEVFEENAFDYIISSHVIEHIPDFIGFFIAAAKILRPGGQIIKLIPDRQYTFDALRRNSTIEDIEKAHALRLKHPSREMVEDFLRNVDNRVTARDIWSGQYTPSPMHDLAAVTKILEETSPDKMDCHCFTFTPATFRTLIEHVIEHYVPHLEIVEITNTPKEQLEFLVHLVKTSDASLR